MKLQGGPSARFVETRMTSIRSLRRLALVLLAAALGGCCILPFGPGPGGHGPGGGGHGGPGGEFSGPPPR